MAIQLSDHFTYKKLLRFVLPSIGMMIFTSIYGVVDGFFVSNYAGDLPFASINLIMPFIMILSGVGFMMGTGGTALVAKRLGEGNEKEANETFSLLVYSVVAFGIVITIIGELLLKKVAILLGANAQMLPYCLQYGRIILCSTTGFMLQNMFQSFLITAERPKIGFMLTCLAGCTNIVLDAILVAILGYGVVGAAIATITTETIGGLVPFIYFLLPNSTKLRLGKTRFMVNDLWKASSNGVSEFMTNISMSVVNACYNFQLMRLAGSDGVSAYGVIMYVSFIFAATFIGYAIGTAPIIGYNYGAQNHTELKNIFSKSLKIIGSVALVMTAAGALLAHPLAALYVGYDKELMELTEIALRIYCLCFLIMGFNIFGSSFFTALNNGKVSAAISFFRTFLFQIIMVFLLPMLFGVYGIWFSVVVAEALSLMITVFFFVRNRKRYHYI
ncbi:MAG: MATE family efflux transporter [Lachnospiraceae bacterium]|nr:MATE family efflux transporter [Lachnospiraceae bacterium]